MPKVIFIPVRSAITLGCCMSAMGGTNASIFGNLRRSSIIGPINSRDLATTRYTLPWGLSSIACLGMVVNPVNWQLPESDSASSMVCSMAVSWGLALVVSGSIVRGPLASK